MTNVIKRENETEGQYILRAAVIMLKENEWNDFDNIELDGTECGAGFIADCLITEFNINLED